MFVISPSSPIIYAQCPMPNALCPFPSHNVVYCVELGRLSTNVNFIFLASK
ncbi:hypothetical protein FDUTEX481_04745 [Tolypothrix sp. PCC 7601]|nr:hypothetical protein FDUTEX481_04745 [Tolypothrix sp. PCC 7601]